MDYSTPSSSVLHYLLRFVQIPVHQVGDAIYLIVRYRELLCQSIIIVIINFPSIDVKANKYSTTSVKSS